MKELSIEEKAKRYDEAYKKVAIRFGSNVADEIFLKESEDERIIKDIEAEPFDKYEGLTDFERTVADICIGWIGKEYGWKQYIKDNADALLKIAIEKFNSVQDATFEQKPTNEEMKELLHTEYEKGRADAIYEMKNPAFSEVDKDFMYDTLSNLTELKDRYGEGYGNVGKCIDWLKSLKDRVHPKQEWSEEDERNWNNIWDVLDGRFELSDYGYKEAAKWFLENCPKGLKSLRQQPKQEWSKKKDLKNIEEPELTEVEEAVKNLMDVYRDAIRASISTQLLEELNKLYKV